MDEGFPDEFSIIATIRLDKDSKNPVLFRMKHESDWEQLAMTVGTKPQFRYRENTDTVPNHPVFNEVDLADGE